MRKIKNKKIREKAGVAGGCLERGGGGVTGMKWQALPIIHATRRVYTCKTVVYPQIARPARRQAPDKRGVVRPELRIACTKKRARK